MARPKKTRPPGEVASRSERPEPVVFERHPGPPQPGYKRKSTAAVLARMFTDWRKARTAPPAPTSSPWTLELIQWRESFGLTAQPA